MKTKIYSTLWFLSIPKQGQNGNTGKGKKRVRPMTCSSVKFHLHTAARMERTAALCLGHRDRKKKKKKKTLTISLNFGRALRNVKIETTYSRNHFLELFQIMREHILVEEVVVRKRGWERKEYFTSYLFFPPNY